ncbi:MAG: hypothetical protein NVV82_21565 [Sporocytophaga sp.]|nr:hypothetical protein [Sporocytophaga sp.]
MENIYFWVIFNILVLGLLILDLFVLNRKTETVTVKSALWWSAFWIGLAIAFNIFVYFWKGKTAAFEFLTGYLIEESLSVDNLFVFMLIFNYFRVPAEYQRKVLFWGIIGALVLRALFYSCRRFFNQSFPLDSFHSGCFLDIYRNKNVYGK